VRVPFEDPCACAGGLPFFGNFGDGGVTSFRPSAFVGQLFADLDSKITLRFTTILRISEAMTAWDG